jgi:hypothetical protein
MLYFLRSHTLEPKVNLPPTRCEVNCLLYDYLLICFRLRWCLAVASFVDFHYVVIASAWSGVCRCF